METKQCLQCGMFLKKQPNESVRNWETRHKYCSRKCSNDSRKDKPLSQEHKEKIRKQSTGRKHTPESIKKMSGENCHLWKGGKPRCIDCNNNVVNTNAKRCIGCYKKNNTGENSSHWQGGITPENTKIRNSSEYKIWRNGVFLKDNYTCQKCGKYGVYFHADHIKSFADFPELRLEINNGRTLCVPCHYYITFNRNMNDFNKWCDFKQVSD